MWFKGKRGPRTCGAKLERKLPLSAMNVLSYKVPKLRATLDKQIKGAGPMATQKVEIKPTEPKDKVLANNETQKDVIPPQIVIFSHDTSRAINVVQRQKKINIKGRATDKNVIVEVIVNNKEASLDEKGNFDVDIYLGMGKNKIVVRAMDTFENVADKTFTITRAASDVAKADADSKTAAGSYFALVIGNNNYRYIRKLETAKRDARDIAQTLTKVYGFEVKLLLDATRNDTVQAINTIRKSLKENDNLLIYYAGHGEFDKTANKAYWLPVDARSDDDTNWILADRITSNIRRISSKHILVVADSCYSGTFTRRAVTDLSSSQARDRYLKKMQAKKSRTILASGGYEPVSDIGGKGHSVFAAALLNGLKQMEKNTFSAEELFYDHIKERVAGNADQTPEYNIIRNSGHDGGDFVFKRINNY
jgi:orotate phosphoribosyltransferase-like protein